MYSVDRALILTPEWNAHAIISTRKIFRPARTDGRTDTEAYRNTSLWAKLIIKWFKILHFYFYATILNINIKALL